MTPVPFVLSTAVLTAGVVTALRRTLRVVEVHGESMRPALRPGDRVLVRNLRPGRAGARVRRGDVVVIARVGPGEGLTLDGGTNLVIKRAAAVAGDPIPPGFEAHAEAPGEGSGEARVPPGRLLVLGDNPSRSTDSRQWGLLPESRITGVVLRRLNA
ncbi:S26 family signal peptidase [Microbispora amethystogenes]|uniref:S26 family signal peptidase n=1 Tax=Microbispora amethystogenes TaxID=1427754 RepID=A0ABQ4FI91_9ACTN|nr:S26 family signal peptidase [Microbispora amethystogenes]GIH34492.1 S26 family signal peptidase [Microbispora amethystogenes]